MVMLNSAEELRTPARHFVVAYSMGYRFAWLESPLLSKVQAMVQVPALDRAQVSNAWDCGHRDGRIDHTHGWPPVDGIDDFLIDEELVL